MDLNARAVISAVDRFSGPVARMAGALNAFQNKTFARTQAMAQSARRMGQALSGPVALGLGAMIYRTQEFEKKALGARIATIADAMDRFGNIDHAKIARDGEAIKNSVLATSKLLGISPTGLMEAGEAAAKMGIELAKADSIMKNSAILKMADPDVGFGTAAELLGTLSLQFRAPPEVDKYAEWIRSTADKINIVASATRTSVGRIQEGLRQFSGVFATFGASVRESTSLLGGMVQGGLLDAESGTALKSAALRFIKPTLEGLSALSASGIDRRNYMDLAGADPLRATRQLVQQFPGYIGKEEKHYILGQLQKAQKEGRGADPELIEKIAGFINRKTGAKENIEDTYLKVLNTITTAGGNVNIFKFLSDIADKVNKGEITDSQLATIFEGRHIARMKTLFQQWDQVMKLMDLTAKAQGQGLDAVAREYSASAFGRWETAMASLDRAFVRLRESEGITNLIGVFEKLANAIASMPPIAVELIGGLAAGLAALGTAGVALGLTVSGLSGLAAAIAWLGGAVAAVSLPAVAALGAGSYLGYEAYRNWDAIKSKLGNAFDAVAGASSAPAGVDRFDFGGKGLIRDFSPTAGPASIDVTGKVQADVQGTVNGKVNVEVDIKAPDGITVTDKRTSGGELTGTLNKGKTMPDTTGP